MIDVAPKSFNATVLPAIISARQGAAGRIKPAVLREPGKGESSSIHTMRVEAARAWCLLPEHGKEGQLVAEVLLEQFHRLRALEIVCVQQLPDGDVKNKIMALLTGKIIAVQSPYG